MQYRCTILEADGKSSTAVLEAPDPQVLHERLHQQSRTLLGAKPIAVDCARGATSGAAGKRYSSLRMSPNKLLGFVQSMAGALDAGVPVLQALAAIVEQEEDAPTCGMLEDLIVEVSGGNPLSDAMQKYPRTFSYVFCAMVRAGESSGELPSVLESVGEWLEWRIDVAATVRQAMVYPCVVLGAAYFLVLFLLAFVIPSLGDVLSKIGGDVPLASRILFDSSTFVEEHVLWILGGTVGAVAALVVAARTEAGRSTLVSVLATTPITRRAVATINVSQFCRNLSVLLGAGLTVTKALELSRGAAAMRRTREAIDGAVQRILGGDRLTDALASIGMLPPIALSMVRVGEESGRLPDALARLSRVYDREVKATVKRALSMLEPIVTVVLGVIVGGIAALVVSTIYTAMQGVGR